MRAYIVRHGETLFNVKGLKQGWCDSPLTEKGIDQAKQVKEKLKDIDFEFAYSSTSERTMDTLDIITEGRNIGKKALKGLKEINFGTMEGEPEKEVHKDGKHDDDALVIYGAELTADARNRVMNTLSELSRKHEGNVLVVSHCGVMINMMLKIDKEVFISWVKQGGHPMPNCCVLVMDIEGDSFSFVERI